jgi:hypothetical protein
MRSEIREILRQRNTDPIHGTGNVTVGVIPTAPQKMDIRSLDTRLKEIEQTERQLSVEKFQLNKIRVSLLKALADLEQAPPAKQMSRWAQDPVPSGFENSPSRKET